MAFYGGHHRHPPGNYSPYQQNSLLDPDWQQTADTSLKSLDSGSCSQNTKALFCPCISFGNIIGYLQGNDKSNSAACCGWCAVTSLGILGSSASAPALTSVLSQPATYVLYGMCCLGYYIPHCFCGLPLSLEMRAYESGKEPVCDAKGVMETLFCPCCNLGSAEKWALANKGKYTLEKGGACICPPFAIKRSDQYDNGQGFY
jgi:hypothetical protein